MTTKFSVYTFIAFPLLGSLLCGGQGAPQHQEGEEPQINDEMLQQLGQSEAPRWADLKQRSDELEQKKSEITRRVAEMEKKQVEIGRIQREMERVKKEMARKQVEIIHKQLELENGRNSLSLFTPERVMQPELGLSEAQKNTIKSESQTAQAQFNELHSKLQKEMETMASLSKPERLDERQLLEQLDRVLALEQEIKRKRLTLAVRLKNNLTREQQLQLESIQEGKLKTAIEKMKRAVRELEQKMVD